MYLSYIMAFTHVLAWHRPGGLPYEKGGDARISDFGFILCVPGKMSISFAVKITFRVASEEIQKYF